MSFYKYHSLSSLNGSSEEWNIRVRAQCIWKGVNRETRELKGYNIIFVDDSSERIHAFMTPAIKDNFQEELIEGVIYTVKNFRIKLYTGDEPNRPIRNDSHIYFTNETELKKDDSDGLSIPPYAFDLFLLDDLEAMKNDNRFLTDIVAVIEHVPEKTSYIKDNKEKSHVHFSVTDGKKIINVTFFNEFGDFFLKAYHKVLQQPVILTICCGKVSDWKGSLYLTNFPSTRVYFNADHYSVIMLRERVISPDFYAMEMDDDPEAQISIMKVNQIRKLKDDYIEKKVISQMMVKKVDERMSWYTPFCTHCDIEIEELNDKFKCPNSECGRVYPYPDRRFQLYTLCGDETGNIPVVWPNDEICRLTGKTVYDVEVDENEDDKKRIFPQVLKFCEKKTYNFTLVVSNNNVKEGSNVYKASQISEVELSATYSPPPKLSDNMAATEITIDTNETEINLKDNTPTTGKSSTKSRPRINVEKTQSPEPEAKLGKRKLVKLEKV